MPSRTRVYQTRDKRYEYRRIIPRGWYVRDMILDRGVRCGSLRKVRLWIAAARAFQAQAPTV